ncbi:MAG: hypothetical protein LBK59_10340, partial [Bifidobacteriaceae bacterium]|nr:hypothetical protein [Bifidobacteriaceae bacterium]
MNSSSSGRCRLAALAAVASLGSATVLALGGQAAHGAVTIIGVTVAVAQDGTAPFDPSGGLDTGPNNGIVRANDTIRYKVTVSYAEAVGTTTIQSQLPVGMAWDPSAVASTICNSGLGGAISPDGRTLTCLREPTVSRYGKEVFEFIARVNRMANKARVTTRFAVGPLTSPISPVVTVASTMRTDLTVSGPTLRHNETYAGQKGAMITVAVGQGIPAATSPVGMDSIGGAITYGMARPAGLVVTGARTLLGGGD